MTTHAFNGRFGMYKKILAVLMFTTTLWAPAAGAHPGGHGPVDEATAIMIATGVYEQFVDYDPGLGFGKLAKSWKGLPGAAKAIHMKGNGYYIVRIENRAEKKTLYLLLSETGEVYDANFTGRFPNLK